MMRFSIYSIHRDKFRNYLIYIIGLILENAVSFQGTSLYKKKINALQLNMLSDKNTVSFMKNNLQNRNAVCFKMNEISKLSV